MDVKFYSILTNIGKAKIANSAAFGTKVNISSFKVGDSNGQYYDPTEQQTDLVHPVYEGKINDIQIDDTNSNWVHCELVLPGNVGGFFIREYAVFDDEGDMIAIAKCPETYKPLQTSGAVKEMSLDLILVVSNINSVKLEIDKSLIFVTRDVFDNLSDEIFPDKEMIIINHGLNGYPDVRIITTNYGAGIGGAGQTPTGGTESYSVECKTCFLDRDNIKLYVPKKYFLKSPYLEKINNNKYIITFDNSIMSLIIDLINI
jgi:phage-related tail fiber protein